MPPVDSEESEKKEMSDNSSAVSSTPQPGTEQSENPNSENANPSEPKKEKEDAVQVKKDEAPPSTQKTEVESEKAMTPRAPEKIAEESPAAIPAGSKIHTVWVWQESKECLWRLAKKYYGDPWKWKKIFLANRNSILDPNKIYPKQQIVIPPQNESK